MKIYSRYLAVILLSAMPLASALNNVVELPEGPNVKVIRNEDGSKSIYEKKDGQRGMLRKTYDASGTLVSIIIYATGKWDQLTSCKVFDGQKKELYKVAYGYDSDARLVEEQMFDSNEIDFSTGKERLVRRFIYTYDEAGNRSKPICIVLVKGKAYEKIQTRATAPERDPFARPEKKKK